MGNMLLIIHMWIIVMGWRLTRSLAAQTIRDGIGDPENMLKHMLNQNIGSFSHHADLI